jgi:hypothetical protein
MAQFSGDMTYSTLTLEIQQNFQRNDTAFFNNIPNFIRKAEQQLAADVKDLGQLQYVISQGVDSVMRKPELWRQTHSIRVKNPLTTEEKILIERPYEWCRMFQNETNNKYAIKVPEYYSDYNYNNYYLTYVQESNKSSLEIEIAYYAYPKFLSEINQSNYWTTFYPQMLLYSSLFFAAIFDRMDDRANFFNQMYNSILTSINVETTNRVNDNAYEVKNSSQKVPKQLN